MELLGKNILLQTGKVFMERGGNAQKLDEGFVIVVVINKQQCKIMLLKIIIKLDSFENKKLLTF